MKTNTNIIQTMTDFLKSLENHIDKLSNLRNKEIGDPANVSGNLTSGSNQITFSDFFEKYKKLNDEAFDDLIIKSNDLPEKEEIQNKINDMFNKSKVIDLNKNREVLNKLLENLDEIIEESRKLDNWLYEEYKDKIDPRNFRKKIINIQLDDVEDPDPLILKDPADIEGLI